MQDNPIDMLNDFERTVKIWTNGAKLKHVQTCTNISNHSKCTEAIDNQF